MNVDAVKPSAAGASVQDKRKMILSVVGVTLAVGIMGFVLLRYTLLAPASAAESSRRATAIDSESGETFEAYDLEDGESSPWLNPKTGKRTLYPAEMCFWTKDGKAKFEPTYVLLNETVGKPGPTLCPDCGRKVVGHNPMPPVKLLQEAAAAAKK